MGTVEEDRATEEAKSMPVPVFGYDLSFLMHDMAGAKNLNPIVKITTFLCSLFEPERINTSEKKAVKEQSK